MREPETLTHAPVSGPEEAFHNAGGAFFGVGVFCEASSCVASCVGDVTGDGLVGVNDVLAVVAAWGSDDPDADVNGDGIAGTDDLLAVIANWGPCE